MNSFDADPLREIFEHLGIKPAYLMPSLAAWQLQASNPQKDLPVALSVSVDRLRDLAVTSKDFLQIGVFEFFVGLDFLQARRTSDAVEHFDSARRQWIFIDHLPLIALAHMGAGMAHQGAGEFRQAMDAYFKVKQCLQEAEKEPHRLEKFERTRSLQDFWNDLERLLRQAITSLQRDFDSQQEDRLKSDQEDETNLDDDTDIGNGAEPATDSASQTGDEGVDMSVLTISMQPTGAISATDVNDLLYQTVAEIEVLNAALSQPGELEARRAPEVSKIAYAEHGELTVEIVNVSQHVLLFCRWLMAIVPARMKPAEAGQDQSEAGSAGDVGQDGADSSQSWFSLQVESGRVANLIRAYVKSVTGREPDAHEVERLVQVVVHLAELRTNYQLTLS